MLLMVFGGSLGLMLGALGALLGDMLVFLRAFGGTLHAQNFFLDSLPGQIYCSFSYLLSLPSSKSLFSSSWSLFVSILNSQADRPTFKNVGFMMAGARFSKNQGFGSKDALDGVWGLSWARFGCSWGLLWGYFGAFAGSRCHPEFLKRFIWAPLSPHLGPRGASNSPKRLPRRRHGEADGPTKPPRHLWRRI